ncbi:hypothetical protein LTR85_009396 [Meristemomyces frigidus]|nr:hypothetical protein LTR85_009396 [Meristemomyces frigidus]
MHAFITLSTALLASLAAALPAASHISTRETSTTEPFCYQKSEGIYEPANGATITQDTATDSCTDVTILYCSGQYDKTSSLSASVWLSTNAQPDIASGGEILALDVSPDNQNTTAGYYSYYFTTSICPSDGDYATGSYELSVYETETGYYNAYNYEIHSINVTLSTS